MQDGESATEERLPTVVDDQTKVSVLGQTQPGVVQPAKKKKRRKKKKTSDNKLTPTDIGFYFPMLASKTVSVPSSSSSAASKVKVKKEEGMDVEIEYVSSDIWEEMRNDPGFASMVDKFSRPEELLNPDNFKDDDDESNEGSKLKGEKDVKSETDTQLRRNNGEDSDEDMFKDEDEDEDTKKKREEEEGSKISKKKLKKLKIEQIAVLKQRVARPDLVELHDVNSQDPEYLLFLKSYRNAVPVPRHWSQRRKYLQGKRGIEKPPFRLPDFIESTGIGKIRQSVMDKEGGQTMKQKSRERTQPKMGKIDIDYEVLYDAFFKYQTKPKLSGHGKLYYEGKEFEVDVKTRRPGHLSKELREALGMGPAEGSGALVPPPWLINMQRNGPPPSYPSLRIPGLNAPIPPGASFGYSGGQWGKPPVDELGRPLYGDPFGVIERDEAEEQSLIDRSSWGELKQIYDNPSDPSLDNLDGNDQMDQANQDENDEDDENNHLMSEDGGITSGISSTSSGIETPDYIELRKKAPVPASVPQLPLTTSSSSSLAYQVLSQADPASSGGALLGSSLRYNIPSAADGPNNVPSANPDRIDFLGTRQRMQKTEITFDPSELEASDEGLTDGLILKKFQEQKDSERDSRLRERQDFSDLIDEQAAKQKRKDKNKKTKDFKF